MVAVKCPDCGIEFWIPGSLYEQRKKDGADFCCPNGHKMHYGDSENKKLRDRVSMLERRIERLEEAVEYWKKVAYGYKGQWRKEQKKRWLAPPPQPEPYAGSHEATLAHGE